MSHKTITATRKRTTFKNAKLNPVDIKRKFTQATICTTLFAQT